jgi:lysophospholipid acyltransferase (LPLAT)-like uncharacterized protein
LISSYSTKLRGGTGVMKILKTTRKKLVPLLGPWLAYWVIKGLGLTMRFEHIHPEIPRSFVQEEMQAIGVIWHGRLLMMVHAYKGQSRKGLSFLVSSHRDGQVVEKALECFGYHAILGSTTRRGFFALREMIKAFCHRNFLRMGEVVGSGPSGVQMNKPLHPVHHSNFDCPIPEL